MNLGGANIHRLFSVVICVDQDFAIVHASDTVRKYVPKIDENPTLDAVFNIVRPISLNSFEEAKNSVNSLFLMTCKEQQFAVRTQLIMAEMDGREVLCFCGAPWLVWINSNCPDTTLSLQDFSVQDVQLDQLFYMSTEKKMVEDLRGLNDELRAAREEKEKAHEEKQRFFAQMSHEMRTPLNAVVSALQILKSKNPGEDTEGIVNLGLAASENLVDVINHSLDLSKLEALDDNLGVQTFNVAQLLESVVDIVGARAMEKSLPLILNIDELVCPHYIGNMLLIKQALLNLTINAIKFTHAGQVTLRATSTVDTANTHSVVFEVIDTGIGISTKDQEKVFDAFWSSSQNAINREKGTGLGLDIVKRNIHSMGGELTLESTPGEGSTFGFALLLATSNGSEAGLSNRSDEEIQFHGSLLLVDDNEPNRVLGTMILESMGIDVSAASSGEQAIAAVRSRNFDLVLMDVNMPELDGFEATSLIRAFKTDSEQPIVALTAYASDAQRARSADVGMNGFITKPFDRKTMVHELGRWMKSRTPIATTYAQISKGGDALVNHDLLRDLQNQIGPDNCREVVSKFLGSARSDRERLLIGADERDVSTVLLVSHTLASNCQSFGLQSVGQLFEEIELQARSGVIANSQEIEAASALLVAGMQSLEKTLVQNA